MVRGKIIVNTPTFILVIYLVFWMAVSYFLGVRDGIKIRKKEKSACQ
jgi:preprotein translocase subunit YajC